MTHVCVTLCSDTAMSRNTFVFIYFVLICSIKQYYSEIQLKISVFTDSAKYLDKLISQLTIKMFL